MKVALTLCVVCAFLAVTTTEASEDTLKSLLMKLLDDNTEEEETQEEESNDNYEDEEEQLLTDLKDDLMNLEAFRKCQKCTKTKTMTKTLQCTVSESQKDEEGFSPCRNSVLTFRGQRYESCQRKGGRCSGRIKLCESLRCVKAADCSSEVQCVVYTRDCEWIC
ncbi:uncharacterized protein LOC106178321 [Lingula anatina]|uniref:Uncharacterized protein LOC106178321 n=1 Tax=Lingula anatina TaxID=7574 RepID=A0A1S3K2N3_LINAN|nr:uncharacterized protein LOC106178321 [Lingula anatina]|eukprot:XP_013416898.1 uncharacterized protein LOC106178321 [Lingula anatina]